MMSENNKAAVVGFGLLLLVLFGSAVAIGLVNDRVVTWLDGGLDTQAQAWRLLQAGIGAGVAALATGMILFLGDE